MEENSKKMLLKMNIEVEAVKKEKIKLTDQMEMKVEDLRSLTSGYYRSLRDMKGALK